MSATNKHEEAPFEEWFCSSCNTLLFRIVPAPGMHISIRCRRCGAIIERRIDAPRYPNGPITIETHDTIVHLFHRLEDRLDELAIQFTQDA